MFSFRIEAEWSCRILALALAMLVATGGRPASAAEYLVGDDRQLSAQSLLGFVLFNSSDLYGSLARRDDLSCNDCHGLGGLAGVARRLTIPIPVPDLRNVAARSPLTRNGSQPDIPAFIRHAITEEFDGPAPPAILVAALDSYLRTLPALDNPLVDGAGRPRPGVAASIAAGHAAFVAQGCDGCHSVAGHVAGRSLQDIGTGGRFISPDLRQSNAGPYLHDSSAPDLQTAVRRHRPAVPDRQVRLLLPYLRALCAGRPDRHELDVGPWGAIGVALLRLDIDLAQRNRMLALADVGAARRLLGAAAGKPAPAPAAVAMNGTLQDVENALAAEDFDRATQALPALRRQTCAAQPADCRRLARISDAVSSTFNPATDKDGNR